MVHRRTLMNYVYPHSRSLSSPLKNISDGTPVTIKGDELFSCRETVSANYYARHVQMIQDCVNGGHRIFGACRE